MTLCTIELFIFSLVTLSCSVYANKIVHMRSQWFIYYFLREKSSQVYSLTYGVRIYIEKLHLSCQFIFRLLQNRGMQHTIFFSIRAYANNIQYSWTNNCSVYSLSCSIDLCNVYENTSKRYTYFKDLLKDSNVHYEIRKEVQQKSLSIFQWLVMEAFLSERV